MVELSLMASATFSMGIIHKDPGLCRLPLKEFQVQLPGHMKRQERLKSGPVQLRAQYLDDSWQSMSQLPDNHRAAVPAPFVPNHMLIDVTDPRPDSVLFSFGIAEQCIRHEKIVKFLMSGSNIEEGEDLDISLLTELMGFNNVAVDMWPQPLVATDDKFYLYEAEMDNTQLLVGTERQLFGPKPLLDFVGTHSSNIVVQPDGRMLFTGSSNDMKDLLSLVAEFYPSHKSTTGSKQSMVVPYFAWSGGGRRQTNTRGASAKLQTEAVPNIKSLGSVKLRPQPKKTKIERNLYRKNSFYACETLLSAIVAKNKSRTVILSLMKSGPEITQLLTQFSAGIAGTGLAVLFSVFCRSMGGKVPFSVARLLSTGFGLGLFWLSWAVTRLRDNIRHTNMSSNKLKLREEEIVVKIERSVNEILFRALTLMAVAVLRFV